MLIAMRSLFHLVYYGFLFSLVGCGGSTIHIDQPSLNPASAALQAMSACDANKNSNLDGEELNKLPSVLAALARIDKNNDKTVSEAELKERLSSYVSAANATMQVSLAFYLDGNPLEGAQVTLVPEAFLEASHKRITGTTDSSGGLMPTQEGLAVSGVYTGLYRVEISWKDASSGQERLPARYNTATTLGVEIALDNPDLEHFPPFLLTSQP
jgi:hypothetical protein